VPVIIGLIALALLLVVVAVGISVLAHGVFYLCTIPLWVVPALLVGYFGFTSFLTFRRTEGQFSLRSLGGTLLSVWTCALVWAGCLLMQPVAARLVYSGEFEHLDKAQELLAKSEYKESIAELKSINRKSYAFKDSQALRDEVASNAILDARGRAAKRDHVGAIRILACVPNDSGRVRERNALLVEWRKPAAAETQAAKVAKTTLARKSRDQFLAGTQKLFVRLHHLLVVETQGLGTDMERNKSILHGLSDEVDDIKREANSLPTTGWAEKSTAKDIDTICADFSGGFSNAETACSVNDPELMQQGIQSINHAAQNVSQLEALIRFRFE
jgi:hypothetical protein